MMRAAACSDLVMKRLNCDMKCFAAGLERQYFDIIDILLDCRMGNQEWENDSS